MSAPVVETPNTNALPQAFHTAKRYVGSIGLVSILYGVNIVLGLVRDSALASTFGATQQLDSLLLGLNFVRTISLQVAVSVTNVLVPILVTFVLAADGTSIISFSGRWLRLSLSVLFPASIILALAAQPLAVVIGPGLDAEGRVILVNVLRGLAPLLIIFGCAGLMKAVSDSYRQYFAHPIFLGMGTLGLIFGVLLGASQWGVYAGVIGIVGGSFLGLLVEIFVVRRELPLRPLVQSMIGIQRGSADSASLPLPIRNILFMLGSSFLILMQGIIERSYLSYLPTGTVAAYSLALSVLAVPSALLLPAISSVLLPRLSAQNATGKLVAGRRYGLLWSEYLVLIGLFAGVTLVLWGGSDLVVQTLFQRGRFSAEAAALTAYIMRWLSLSFIGYVLGIVFRQVVLARRLVIYDLVVSLVVLLAEIILLAFLVPRFGLDGIVLEANITVFVGGALYFGVIHYARH